MPIKIITLPTVEPITLAEAKLHLRVDSAEEDALIAAQLSAARESAEQFLGVALAVQTWELALDAFPAGAIELPGGLVSAVESITYANAAGVDQIAAGSSYYLDSYSTPNWLVPSYGTTWPSSYATPNAIRVRYVVGGATVSPSIKAAILLTLGHLFAQREDTAVVSLAAIPMGSRALLQPFRTGMGI